MVELGKSKENVKIEPGTNSASPSSINQETSSPTPSPPAGSHYHHHNNVHSNHSNPPSPIPSTVVPPSSFPSAQKVSLKNSDEKPMQQPPRPPSRKNLSASTPP